MIVMNTFVFSLLWYYAGIHGDQSNNKQAAADTVVKARDLMATNKDPKQVGKAVLQCHTDYN
jgi:hypothetical protein